MNPYIKITCYGGICVSALILIVCLFFGDLVKSFAKDYINQRIEPSVTASVTFTEDKVLPQLNKMPELQEKIRTEIKTYRDNPLQYINKVTTTDSNESKNESTTPSTAKAATSSLLSILTKDVQSISQTIKQHFERTFQNLLNDLMIFSTTNIIGFSCVLIFLAAARYYRRTFILAAMILLSATLYAISSYINQNWFFNVLLDMQMGYWYPMLIISICFYLYLKHLNGKLKQAIEDSKNETIENLADVLVDVVS